MSYNAIDAITARQLVQQGSAILVDVRTADERARQYIPGALSMPLGTIEAGVLEAETRTIIFHCASGHRTHAHAERLAAATVGSAHVLTGGLAAWKKTGGPVVQDKRQPIEIMRQVQIVAGSLVVAGGFLSLTVSPWFLGVSIFVGAGLAVAGVTGFCGMARLLARMPWNRRPQPAAGAALGATR